MISVVVRFLPMVFAYGKAMSRIVDGPRSPRKFGRTLNKYIIFLLITRVIEYLDYIFMIDVGDFLDGNRNQTVLL